MNRMDSFLFRVRNGRRFSRGQKRERQPVFFGDRGFFPLRILTLISVMLLAFSCAGAENLLRNGSFEDSDDKGLPLDWYTDAYVLDEGYTVFSLTREDKVDGESAACIRNIGENDARFAQTVDVEPESLYRFSGYIRTEGVEGGRGANLSVEGLYTFSESCYDTSDGWRYIEWYGETGGDQTYVTLFARLGGYSGESTGKAWFDDLKLEPVDVVPGSLTAARWYQERTVSYYDEEQEPETDGTASPAWPRLIMLTLAYTLAAALVLQWGRRKSRGSLEQETGESRVIFAAGLSLAFLLRMIISWNVLGYMVDVNCFTAWGGTMARVGPAGFYPETNFCDYPPAYTYVLGLNSLICRAIPGISEGMTRVVFRFFPCLCDILSCIVLDGFLRKKDPGLNAKLRVTGILLLAFHPVTILNSAAWCQMDSVLTLLLLLVAIWALEGKWEKCLPCYMLSVLVKPQALMLGFLGLAAMICVWIRQKDARRKILTGLAAAAGVFLAVVVPFSLRQDPFWIITQYTGTLASYPYASVNTANFYYLLGGNWSGIDRAAPAAAPLLLALTGVMCGASWYFRGRGKWRMVLAETGLSAAFSAWNIVCWMTRASWGMVGTGAMVFAFVIVLSLYLRKNRIEFLPYLGGLLFLFLYVFGVKMHERYIFPAFLLLALSYGLQRDRRIMIVLLTVTCTAFINEGIVLDNSIRLGSAMGHLNQDTRILALILSAVNCLVTLYAVDLGVDLAVSDGETGPVRRRIRDEAAGDSRLHWRRADSVALSVILAVYSLISFGTLGSTKAPQTAWTSTEFTENIVIDLGEDIESFDMLYFARVSRYDFSAAVSRDGQRWEDETWAQMDQGQCWKWKYVTESTDLGNGKRSYGSARHWFSGRYVRITAHQINLALCEVIFRDPLGNILPIASVERFEGDPESSLYSDPRLAVDEQDTLEALPVYFHTAADQSEGEENLSVAQPSWWNSTYFDEIYHARTAWEFLTGSAPYETSHPPLGKVLMSWGVAVFGMTPFGWRFAGALAGVAMLAVIYLLGKQLTKRTAPAAFACGLLALDCMHLTQTQIATIDSFPVLFILTAFFFMLRFLQTDWRTEKRIRVLTDLGLCGLSMGLAIASKWIGIYAGAGLAVLFFWHGFRVIRRDRSEAAADGKAAASGIQEKTALPRSRSGKNVSAAKQYFRIRPADGSSAEKSAFRIFLGYCLWCVLFFVAIPAVIYLISYLPYFAYRHFTSLRDYLDAVMASQQGMLSYHSTPGLGMDHPFYSPWYEWPVIGKPMFYSTKQYVFSDELSFSIFCFGNPVIWWTGIPAMLCCVWFFLRNRQEISELGPVYGAGTPRPGDGPILPLAPVPGSETESAEASAEAGEGKDTAKPFVPGLGQSPLDTGLVFLLIGFLAQYLPWTLVPRGTYIYHYFASVPFLILSITVCAEQLRGYSRKAGNLFLMIFTVLALSAMILFFPYVTGILAPVEWLDAGRGLLKIWY